MPSHNDILENLLTEERIAEFVKKINDLKRDNKLDLSTDEDLSLAIMNLIAIEEHLFFTAEKTEKDGYFALLKTVREMRKNLLKRIVKEYEGEVWCTSKHLLSGSMRLMEVGTKHLKEGSEDTAKEMFKLSYELYLLFWGINMDVIKPGESKLVDKAVMDKLKKLGINQKIPGAKKPQGLLGKLGELVKKAVNCCIE
ncbi:MAG: hypothetical protein FJZ04_00525 [Candidatus Moranbacteria bacterium]|nr:hypothetical protein [Candidatus Moranbacteria bacterium]